MLGREGARSAFAVVRARMGKNAAQVDKILALLGGDGRANLAAVLEALYPEKDKVQAQASLRQLRLELEKAAKKAPVVVFTLESDGQTRSEPEERFVWFAGESLANFAAADVQRIDPVFIPMEAIRQGPAECVVVYAMADREEAEKLIGSLAPLFKKAEIGLWRESHILAGESRQTEWERACQRADIALLLLSPAFEVDDEAQRAKARLAELRKRIVPVQLHETAEPNEGAFRGTKGRAFDGCGSSKRIFALGLSKQVQARLAKELQTPEERGRWDFVEGDAEAITFGEVERSAGMRGPVMDFLREWATKAGEPPFCALLGELGTGKTTTAKEFTRQFREERAAGGAVPLPLFLDLRYVRDLAAGMPNLDAILDQAIRLGWDSRAQGRKPSVAEILEAVDRGAVLIFDGLDEVLVQVTQAQGQMFTQQLFRALPKENPKGKLLITCRTQYFRNVKHESSHFTAQDRDHVKAESYRALVLLPFTEGQIQQYLSESLGEAEGERAFALIQTVHNLPELAKQPYTLSLIRRQFKRLEQWKAEGRRVTGVTLYRFFVEEWLERDGGKHRFIPEHKERLMEHVAAALVRAKQRSWTAEQLEEWLLEYLEGNAKMRRRYLPDAAGAATQQELLMEDLRTATFLVREGDQFRFAHSSLQEYFLAMYLRRALEEGYVDGWALTGVSRETLAFLGQSLEERPSAEALVGLEGLRDSYRALASELAFRYCVLGYPAPAARGFQLPGADLWEFGLDALRAERLDLSGINLRGADLGNSSWRRCDLAGGDFAGAKAERSEWLD